MAQDFPTTTELAAHVIAGGAIGGVTGFTYPNAASNPHLADWAKLAQQLLARMLTGLQVYKADGGTSPATALRIGIRSGIYRVAGTLHSYAGETSVALANNATNYVYLVAGAANVTVNQTGFPTLATAGSTGYVPLAVITTGSASASGTSGDFSADLEDGDLVDYRGACALQAIRELVAADLADNAVTADAIAASQVTAAKLADAVADAIATVTLTPGDDADGTGTLTIQAVDAQGNSLAANVLVRVRIGTADDFGADALTDFSVTTGTQWEEVTANAEYLVVTDATGLAVMNIDNGGAGTLYAWASIGGRAIVASGAIAITA